MLALKLPPATKPGGRLQQMSIPAPPSRTVPFWTDSELRMVVVALESGAGLLIPYKHIHSYLVAVESTPANALKGKRKVEWANWGPQISLLLPMCATPFQWSYRSAYSYGSRIAVSLFDNDSNDACDPDVVTFDLNPWAAKHARRSPPARSSDAWHKDYDKLTPVRDAKNQVLPHVAFHGPCIFPSLGQAPAILAMDHAGFTTVVSYCFFLQQCGLRLTENSSQTGSCHVALSDRPRTTPSRVNSVLSCIVVKMRLSGPTLS